MEEKPIFDNDEKYLPDIWREYNTHDAIERWLLRFPSKRTRWAYKFELDKFAAFAGYPDAETMAAWFLHLDETEAHKTVNRYRAAQLARSNNPKTINRSLATLNSFVASARLGGFTTLRLKARGEAVFRFWDTPLDGIAQLGRLIAAARDQADEYKAARDAAIMLLLFGFGLHRMEVIALDVDDVDLDKGTIAITDRARKAKEVRIMPDLVRNAISTWLRFRSCASTATHLFCSLGRRNTSGRLSEGGLLRIQASLRLKAEIETPLRYLRLSVIAEIPNVFEDKLMGTSLGQREASVATREELPSRVGQVATS